MELPLEAEHVLELFQPLPPVRQQILDLLELADAARCVELSPHLLEDLGCGG